MCKYSYNIRNKYKKQTYTHIYIYKTIEYIYIYVCIYICMYVCKQYIYICKYIYAQLFAYVKWIDLMGTHGEPWFWPPVWQIKGFRRQPPAILSRSGDPWLHSCGLWRGHVVVMALCLTCLGIMVVLLFTIIVGCIFLVYFVVVMMVMGASENGVCPKELP